MSSSSAPSTETIVNVLKGIRADVASLEQENATLKKTMNAMKTLQCDQRQTLHWVLKVGNLRKSLEFHEKVLNMTVLRHEEFNEGCEAKCNGDFARPWSKTMIAFKNAVDGEKSNFALELTYNYGIKGYKRGNDLKYLGVSCTAANLEAAKQLGYSCEASGQGELFYDVRGPDGVLYRCKVSADEAALGTEIFWGLALHVADVRRSYRFWVGLLGMQPLERDEDSGYLRVAYGGQMPLEFYQLPKGESLDHCCAPGRVAFTTSVPDGVFLIRDLIEAPCFDDDDSHRRNAVHTSPVTLPTPGKADVQVIILLDPDQYEICFVGKDGFYDLCTTKEGDDAIDWKMRTDNGADQDRGKFVDKMK